MTFWSILRQRCWGLVLVVAGVCVITFIISHLIPGDPARLLAGDRASDAIVENIRQQLGLDQPLYVQFYRYVSDLFHGDLGTSIRTGRPVLEELRIFFPATLELAFGALLLALLIGIPLGILSAVWRNRWLDHLVRIMAITGISTPAFWLGLGVIVLFYGHLQILPGGGRLDDWLDPPTHVTGFYLLDALLEGNGEVFFNALQHLILPALTLAFVHLGIVARQIRSAMLEQLSEDYIRTARASGLPGWYIVLCYALPLVVRQYTYVQAAKTFGASRWHLINWHILRNSLPPLIVQASLDIGSAILMAATLGFIGLGAQQPSAEWGAMVANGRNYVLDQWWYCAFPGAAILLTAVGFNLFGDGIRDLLDPKAGGKQS
ncbi:ABC transporter permease subunit [Escherichia coli]